MPSVGVTESEDGNTSIINSDNAFESQDKSEVEDTVASPKDPSVEDSDETSRIAVDEALVLYLEYIDELKNDELFSNYHGTMCLVYINDDDVPELVINRSYPNEGVIICTVSYGSVETIFAERSGTGIDYIERGNKITYREIIQDVYYVVVCCIEDGKFVIQHEGSQDASRNQCYWDGEAVSCYEIFDLEREAFDFWNSKSSDMSSIRAVDMVYEIAAQLSDPPPNITVNSHDPVSGLLTSDGAFAIYASWQDNHPKAPPISRQYSICEFIGEQYYFFPAKYTQMYWYNVIVHMESGKMLYWPIEDGGEPTMTIEPLDDWYDYIYNS